uniref:NB-ARC domain-containing protein n=1 Tax=Fagus sylvatica TaxID=28930 RepID=A0A2N9HNW4_FAGSY
MEFLYGVLSVKEIEDARDDVERRVEVARRNVEQIEGKVRRWLTDVEEITAKVGKFFEDEGQAKMKCCNGQCPNLKARYKLSKRAYKLGLEVKEIMVMKALKDDNIRAIGVYGMGGTGKTMLVGKVATQAMEEKLFEEVVTIVVSQTPNLKKIQEDIAEKLDNEATYLFRKIVGDLVETLDFQSIVVEVIEECGGLPIALTAVAHALKSEKAQNVWKDALRQLRMANPIDIEGMHEKVYPSIKVKLQCFNKEAQSLFLFCSTFQEDVDIPIEFLWRLLVGLDFFEDVFTMEEVRNRVYTLVKRLKACCLLLEGEESGTVKMHDVIRDVLEDSILMALYDFDSSELPQRLECPQVKLIILERQRDALQIPNTFFEGVKNLKVLVLSRIRRLTKLPSSLLPLDNLQALHLIDYEDFPKLKYLKIKENAELQYIISWTGVQRVAFPLLESIYSRTHDQIGKDMPRPTC